MKTREKALFLCLLKTVLFEHHSLLCILISYMGKRMYFKRHITFHCVQIIVVTSGLMVIVVGLHRTIRILYSDTLKIFLFFMCLPPYPVGISVVCIL